MKTNRKRIVWRPVLAAVLVAGLAASSASAFIIPSKPVTTVPPVAVDPEPPIVDPPVVVDPPPPDTGNPPPDVDPPPPVSSVPEPGTLLLGLSAVGLAGWYRRRR